MAKFLLLLAVIAAGLAGYWQMEHHHARATLALVAAAAALLVLVQVDWQARWAETRFWAFVAGGLALTFEAWRPGLEWRALAFGCADVNQVRKSP